MRIEASFLEPEVRDGFYIPSEVKQAWAAELQVLSEIDRICKKYEIPYFADWGTLLGAVRHGGFIPWDDDLDISMKRQDYKRFLQVAKTELPEEYSVFTYATHPEFWSFMGRVVAKNRICFETEHLKKFYSFPYIVGIDIFILDYVSEDAEKNEERNHSARYVIEVADAIAEGRVSGKDATMMLDFIEKKHHVVLKNRTDLHALRVQMYRLAEDLFGKFPEEDARELTRMMPNELYEANKFRLSKEYYDKQIWLPFENMLIPVPNGYDEMLRRRYGDYMKLVRNCSGHDYPFFGTQRKQLQKVLDFEMPGYYYNGIAERDTERGRANSLKGIVREACRQLEKNHQTLLEREVLDMEILQETQQLAIDMGTLIEQCKGEGHPTVRFLENLCEVVYQLAQSYTIEMLERFEKVWSDLAESVKRDILERKEAVFVIHKASEWQYIQSVWQEAMEDENCDAYVVPIPYFYKEYDGTFREMKYEGELFPEEVSIVNYDEFDFGLHYPEMIFIQNPYDEFNPVMSVHSFFYSGNLKQFTEKLVYIPPFVLEEFDKDSYREYYNMEYYCTMPGVVNSDRVIVQSENMRKLYIEKLTEFAGIETRSIWEEKVLGLGSPKEDSSCTQMCNKELPAEWKKYIQKTDGSLKKAVLYYTGVSSFVQYGYQVIRKMEEVFSEFTNEQEDVVILWKMQDLVKPTLQQSNMQLYQEVLALEKRFKEESLGILVGEEKEEFLTDVCNAYYGDASPLAQKCRSAGKPVMLQKVI